MKKLPSLTLVVSLVLASISMALATPKYIQGNYATPQSTVPAVTVPYLAAQTAGNLNVVIVGWNDATAQVSSVTDTSGNVYQLAAGPTVLTGSTSVVTGYLLLRAPRLARTRDGDVQFRSGLSGHSGHGI